jgi:hypothetical protein
LIQYLTQRIGGGGGTPAPASTDNEAVVPPVDPISEDTCTTASDAQREIGFLARKSNRFTQMLKVFFLLAGFAVSPF